MANEIIIYADESEKKGRYYSNFYGGLAIRSQHLDSTVKTLTDHAHDLGLTREIKWQKVTAQYLDRYIGLMAAFFDFVARDLVKVRIMFTQNRYIPKHLSPYHKEEGYFILYYLFIKHAFGLKFANRLEREMRVRLYLDRLPDTKEKIARFRSYLLSLNENAELRRAGIRFHSDQITEVKSHDHILLQCIDVVLGSMQFRLNDKHKSKPPGSRIRSKRTIAKEKLYHIINRRIRSIHKNFNIGITTGRPNGPRDLWDHCYRHWLFMPTQSEIDQSTRKGRDN